jgi:hypothetical protein
VIKKKRERKREKEREASVAGLVLLRRLGVGNLLENFRKPSEIASIGSNDGFAI